MVIIFDAYEKVTHVMVTDNREKAVKLFQENIGHASITNYEMGKLQNVDVIADEDDDELDMSGATEGDR